jgi:putative ABC transport system permease protein
LRSFLTLLGIAVGIAAVILLTSIGEGIHRFVLAEFTQFGTNVISVTPGKVKTSAAPRSACRAAPGRCRSTTPRPGRLPTWWHDAVVWGNAEVKANGRLRRDSVYGVGPGMPVVFKGKVRSGQFLPDDESRTPAPSSCSAPN